MSTGRGAGWKHEHVAHGFLHRRRRVLPLLQVQEDLLARVLRRHGHGLERVLDLGSGDGAMSELVLSEWPAASAVLVDHSPPMLERAAIRLAPFAGRWQTVDADLSAPGWADALPAGGYDAAVTSFALHHLDSEQKRSLFAALPGLLRPGAMFLNMDIVTVEGPLQGSFEEDMAANLLRLERDRGGRRSEDDIRAELALAFDADEEDMPDSAEQQVARLAEAGFQESQIHFKWGEAAIYGGCLPAS